MEAFVNNQLLAESKNFEKSRRSLNTEMSVEMNTNESVIMLASVL